MLSLHIESTDSMICHLANVTWIQDRALHSKYYGTWSCKMANQSFISHGKTSCVAVTNIHWPAKRLLP